AGHGAERVVLNAIGERFDIRIRTCISRAWRVEHFSVADADGATFISSSHIEELETRRCPRPNRLIRQHLQFVIRAAGNDAENIVADRKIPNLYADIRGARAAEPIGNGIAELVRAN